MSIEPVYQELDWPPAPEGRPWVFVNMVSTIDGKIITGEPDEPVQDLGSARDHATMHWLEAQAGGILIGAATVRATPRMNLPAGLHRFCASLGGVVSPDCDFFARGEQGRTWLVTSQQGAQAADPRHTVKAFGEQSVDWPEFLAWCRTELGIERLLVEGGGELNAALMAEDLVDELFLTLAPKIKGGRQTPTLAGGDPLPRQSLLAWQLTSCLAVDSEVFLRYRRHR